MKMREGRWPRAWTRCAAYYGTPATPQIFGNMRVSVWAPKWGHPFLFSHPRLTTEGVLRGHHRHHHTLLLAECQTLGCSVCHISRDQLFHRRNPLTLFLGLLYSSLSLTRPLNVKNLTQLCGNKTSKLFRVGKVILV